MADAAPEIRYPNLSGALVIAAADDTAPCAQCDGCLETMPADGRYSRLDDARQWAREHALRCAALPHSKPADQAHRERYAGLAQQYAERAVQLLEGHRRELGNEAEARDPAGTAQTYAAIAAVYARLADHQTSAAPVERLLP